MYGWPVNVFSHKKIQLMLQSLQNERKEANQSQIHYFYIVINKKAGVNSENIVMARFIKDCFSCFLAFWFASLLPAAVVQFDKTQSL